MPAYFRAMAPVPKARDGMSAIVLWMPRIDDVMSGDDWVMRCRIARTRVRCSAIMDRLEHSLRAHPTDGVLSHQTPMCRWCKSARYSRIIQVYTMPSSSRSELVMVPDGLSALQNWFCMSGGNGTCHTVGGMWALPGRITPPTPILDTLQ